MSLDVLTAIWRDPPCKGGDLLCLLAIADNADEHGYAWPSVATIARKAAMGERGAQKCIKKLAEMGLISVKSGGGRNKTNAYQITTNGVGAGHKHQNPEQNTPPPSSPFKGVNPEQSDINPEPAFAKPRTPVHPNSQELPKEPPVTPLSPAEILTHVIGLETAQDFVAHRKQMKKPLTELAAKRMVAALINHPDPEAVFDLSIRNQWQGIFPEKVTDRNGGQHERPNQHPQATERSDAALEQMLRLGRTR